MSKSDSPMRARSQATVTTPTGMWPLTPQLGHWRWAATAFSALLVLLDVTFISLALIIAYSSQSLLNIFDILGPGTVIPTRIGLMMLGVATGTTMLMFSLGGLYRFGRRVSRVDDFYKICTRVTLGLVLAVTLNLFLFGSHAVLSRRMLVLGWLLTIIGVQAGRLAHRTLVRQLRLRGVALDRLLIVGTGRTAQVVSDKIRRTPALGYEIIGFLAHTQTRDDADIPRALEDVPVYGTTDRLAEVVRRHHVDDLIIALEGVSHAEMLDLLDRVIDVPVNIKVYPETFRLITNDELSIGDFGGLPMVTVRSVGLKAWSRALKRVVDLVVSAIVLVLLSPLMLLLALLIKLDSQGPVLFIQERVGHDGKSFKVLKFRSMPVNAESETGPVFATADDPRPTRLGRFIRRYSLDELPQFVNVLRGEMSLVGPRPERPFFVEQFSQTIPRYMVRHREKSGITGWAQVNGLRGDTSIEERTRYDLYYVENWSVLFDVKIMIKTLANIFSNDSNAY